MSILPDAETFRRLADGTLRGPGPACLRTALAALAAPYGLAAAARNACYDWGLCVVHPAAVPVISVGNLTLGGTGKTPLVAWVARQLAAAGRRPAVVSRGYAARPGRQSDEAAELAILLPLVPHIANRDRVAGVAAAARDADVAILDDGFQHRRLRRELDIVAIDASDPFGCGRIVPRGLLRERVGGLSRAGAVVLTRADTVTAARRAAIREAVTRARRNVPPPIWVETEHRPVAIRSAGGATEPIESLRGRRVAAFCGVGNPAAFRRTLEGSGADLAGFRPFADHHAYSATDLAGLAGWADALAAEQVLTTLKDLVKIRREMIGGRPLAAIEVAIEPLTDAALLEAAVLAAAAGGDDRS